jgi:two-component system response regulator PilR (NtrC family)
VSKIVLVVEDDHSTREMVRSILGREGFTVEAVANGNEAIARLIERQYDAVVLDIMMGHGSGEEVLEVLATQRPNVKCVVVISAAAPALLEKIAAANVHAKLRKPFDIHELVNAVRDCVAQADDADSPVST